MCRLFINVIRTTAPLALLLFCMSIQYSFAKDITVNEIATMLGNNDPVTARITIESAGNRDNFLEMPRGKALYSASICYSPPRELNEQLISSARNHINEALGGTPPLSPDYNTWATKVKQRCTMCEPQVRRITRVTTTRDSWGGKIALNCEIQTPSEIAFENQSSLYLLPRIPSLDGNNQSADHLIEIIQQEHVHDKVKIKACAPFLVASDSDSGDGICASSHRFLDYFSENFGKPQIDAWIVIHHYTSNSDLHQHAKKNGGPPCKGIFGYFDPVSQRSANKANPGLIGTLNHELTHAFIYWNAPELPRWLEEGIAALHENTDPQFKGLRNPWRQRFLSSPTKNKKIFCNSVLRMSINEFESDPKPASISRYAMRNIQASGKLSDLYRRVRDNPAMQSLNYEGTDDEMHQNLLNMPGVKEFCAE